MPAKWLGYRNGRVSGSTLGALLTEVGGPGGFCSKIQNSPSFCFVAGVVSGQPHFRKQNSGLETRKVKSRLAYQLRMGAMTLWRNDSALGQYCRRMKSRLGKAEGITATAHKIARIIFSLITTGNTYDDKIAGATTETRKRRRVKSLRKVAHKLGFQLVAAETP